MADLAFPYLADVFRAVRSGIDQPHGDPQQLAHRESDMVLAAVESYGDLRGKVEIINENFHLKVASGSIVSGTNTLTLPSDCSFLRRVQEVDGNGDLVAEADIWVASFDRAGRQGREAAVYRPDQNHLYFPVTPNRSYSVRITHGFLAIPPVHGTVRDGSVASVVLADHESIESDFYNGLDSLYFFDGTGAGQAVATISDYDGPTRAAVPSVNFSTAPDTTTRYTSRVELPRCVYGTFVADIVCRLLSRNNDHRLPAKAALLREQWNGAIDTLAKMERRSSQPIRDAYDYGIGIVDPYDY